MGPLLVLLSSPSATDVARFGPKAANLAALGQVGLPIPEGVCLDAAAYRLQVAALDLEASARGVFAAEDGARPCPQEFTALVRDETRRWADFIRESKITID